MISISDIREVCETVIGIIDDRNELLRENLELREKLKEKEDFINGLYHQNISTTANILNTLIKKCETNQ